MIEIMVEAGSRCQVSVMMNGDAKDTITKSNTVDYNVSQKSVCAFSFLSRHGKMFD